MSPACPPVMLSGRQFSSGKETKQEVWEVWLWSLRGSQLRSLELQRECCSGAEFCAPPLPSTFPGGHARALAEKSSGPRWLGPTGTWANTASTKVVPKWVSVSTQTSPCLASGMLVERGEVFPTLMTSEGLGGWTVRLPEQSGAKRRELGASGRGNGTECW